MKFTLTIDLGNEAMRSGADVANVLGKLARRIELREDGYGDSLTPNGFVAIFDANGNTIGQWRVTDDDPDYADAPAHPDGSNEPLKHFYHP